MTAAILVVPFGAWWLVDRSRRRSTALATPVPVPVPWPTPAATPARVPAPPHGRPVAPRVGPPTFPKPLAVVPPSAPARSGGILAPDREVTVTREEDHQDVLAFHHRPGAGPTPVVVELWSSTDTRGEYGGDYAVEVRLDGRRVGELTRAMSARYRSLVEVAGPVRCRGVIAYGSRGFRIDLRRPDVA